MIAADPGLHLHLSFDPDQDVAAPFVARGARPRVAILREQGVNGQVEMAAAFDRAGFEAVDVHMSDLLEGRTCARRLPRPGRLRRVLLRRRAGRGRGLGQVDPLQRPGPAGAGALLRPPDTFALGVCNGCQMLSNLHELIPGAADWPHFVRNRSEQFEARLSLVEVLESPSVLLRGMAGSRLPIAVAHGEGRAEFASEAQRRGLEERGPGGGPLRRPPRARRPSATRRTPTARRAASPR